jgi:hypothetical protein
VDTPSRVTRGRLFLDLTWNLPRALLSLAVDFTLIHSNTYHHTITHRYTADISCREAPKA